MSSLILQNSNVMYKEIKGRNAVGTFVYGLVIDVIRGTNKVNTICNLFDQILDETSEATETKT